MIPLFKVYMSQEAVASAQLVLNSGFIGQGKMVDDFESRLSDYLCTPNVVTLNSGTSALHLALHLLKSPDTDWPGLQQGDKVLTTALTCTATNWPIIQNGLTPVWVDVDESTLNIDLSEVEKHLDETTKAVMVVHWGGYPVDLTKLREIQERYFQNYRQSLFIIEDCAHAFGARFGGKLIGSSDNLCCFSFQAIKHLTCADGGLLTLPRSQQRLNERARLLRWYGIDRDNKGRTDFRCELDIAECGFKFHMNDVNASIGIGNLLHVDDLIATHRSNAEFYREALSEVSGLSLLSESPNSLSSYWLFTVLVENRTEFMKMMQSRGVQVSRVHERNDIHSCVAQYKTNLPILDRVASLMVCLPVGWWVSEEDREYVVKCIKGGW